MVFGHSAHVTLPLNTSKFIGFEAVDISFDIVITGMGEAYKMQANHLIT